MRIILNFILCFVLIGFTACHLVRGFKYRKFDPKDVAKIPHLDVKKAKISHFPTQNPLHRRKSHGLVF